MGKGIYIQPDSCETDQIYYQKMNRDGSAPIYQKVRFLAYCPHPAEVIIDDGERARVIHRCDLFAKVPERKSFY